MKRGFTTTVSAVRIVCQVPRRVGATSELDGAIFMAGRQVCRGIHREKTPRLFTWSEIKAKFYGHAAWDRLLRLSYVHRYRSYYQLISLMPD